MDPSAPEMMDDESTDPKIGAETGPGEGGAPPMPPMPPPPEPTEPIQTADTEAMVGNLNEAWMFIADGQGPAVAPAPRDSSGGIGGSQTPLPPDVWSALVSMAAVIEKLAEIEPSLASLKFDPTAVVTTKGTKEITKALAQIARSQPAKKVVSDILGQAGGKPVLGPPEGGPPPVEPPPASAGMPEGA